MEKIGCAHICKTLRLMGNNLSIFFAGLKYCSYFIPEDGDEEMYPNVFLAPKPRVAGTPPTLGQIKDAFPLPGVYHFRFKSPLYPGGDRDKGAIPVWMDMTQDATPVPTWKNSIVAKVTRLSVEEEDDDDDDDFGGHGVHVAAPAPQPQVHAPAPAPRQPRPTPAHQHSGVSASSDHLDIFAASPPASAPAPAATTPNLFDSHPPSAPPSGGSNLLDMNDFGASPQTSATPASAGAHADFLGMTAPAPAPTPQPHHQQYPGAGGNMYHPQSTPQQRPPQQQGRPPQQNAFDSFNNQQGAFGGLGTPWK